MSLNQSPSLEVLLLCFFSLFSCFLPRKRLSAFVRLKYLEDVPVSLRSIKIFYGLGCVLCSEERERGNISLLSHSSSYSTTSGLKIVVRMMSTDGTNMYSIFCQLSKVMFVHVEEEHGGYTMIVSLSRTYCSMKYSHHCLSRLAATFLLFELYIWSPSSSLPPAKSSIKPGPRFSSVWLGRSVGRSVRWMVDRSEAL